MSRKVFIGNLDIAMTASDLTTLFKPYGTVDSVQVVVDEQTGRSGGYGYVEMQNQQQAQTAIAALNGRKVTRRSLTVVMVPLMTFELFSPTMHHLLAHIRLLTDRIEEHVQFICGIADLKGTSLEEKEKAVAQFHEQLARVDEILTRLRNQLRMT